MIKYGGNSEEDKIVLQLLSRLREKEEEKRPERRKWLEKRWPELCDKYGLDNINCKRMSLWRLTMRLKRRKS